MYAIVSTLMDGGDLVLPCTSIGASAPIILHEWAKVLLYQYPSIHDDIFRVKVENKTQQKLSSLQFLNDTTDLHLYRND